MILAVTASRWLQANVRSAADQMDGNPIQRNIFTVLLLIGVAVLIRRGKRTTDLLRANKPMVLFFLYCAASLIWSDYPDIAFKRWIKACGDLVAVLVILTDPQWRDALKRFLARVGFLLVPISVLLIQYYPYLGRAYKIQDGRQVFQGVANDKNMLGVICLIFGLGAAWRLANEWKELRRRGKNGPLIAQGMLLVMSLWLFSKANSMTSLACFMMAGVLVFLISRPSIARRRGFLHITVAAMLVVAFSALFLNMGSELVESMGRDATLTGRTELWNEIVGMNGNPLFGTGFESFWMGKRLDIIWGHHWWHPNEAHNGYLEVYLNLGWIGVTLLGAIIITTYRKMFVLLRRDYKVAGFLLPLFVIGVAYSFTEAGFRLLNPIWISFMISAMAAPQVLISKDVGHPDIAASTSPTAMPAAIPESAAILRQRSSSLLLQ
jgi:exopolysaccharide production protein ExoQ